MPAFPAPFTRRAALVRSVTLTGLFLAAIGAVLAGCSSPDRVAITGGSPAQSEGFPLTVDNCGFEVTLPEAPERVVAIKSSSIELLLALGLADKVVGAAFSDGPVPVQWADEAASLPVISDRVPGQEATLAVNPDLVFAGWESNLTADGAGERDLLAKLGIASYVAPSACKEPAYQPHPMTFDLLFSQVEEAGRIFGVPERSRALVDEQRKMLDGVVPSDDGLTALWYSSGSDTPYVGAGLGAPQMILDAAGLTNVVGDVQDTWTTLGWEAVAEANPNVIVLVDAEWNTAASKIAALRANPVTAALPAVQQERFVVVPFPASEAGVRNVEAVISVTEQLRDLGY